MLMIMTKMLFTKKKSNRDDVSCSIRHRPIPLGIDLLFEDFIVHFHCTQTGFGQTLIRQTLHANTHTEVGAGAELGLSQGFIAIFKDTLTGHRLPTQC